MSTFCVVGEKYWVREGILEPYGASMRALKTSPFDRFKVND